MFNCTVCWLLTSDAEQEKSTPHYIQVGERRYIEAREAYLQGLSDDEEEEVDRPKAKPGDIGAANSIPCHE